MKNLTHSILFAVSLSLGIAPLTSIAAETTAPGPQIVRGDLLKIEGEFYTVHDTAGHETKLHVDKTTKLDGTFKTGDRVEAQVTDKGHAFFMKHMNVASAGPATSGPRMLTGDLLKIEEEFYTVHDTAGHETKLHVDKTTKLDGTFKTGDRVEAQMTEKNHAISLKHANPSK